MFLWENNVRHFMSAGHLAGLPLSSSPLCSWLDQPPASSEGKPAECALEVSKVNSNLKLALVTKKQVVL